jgi:putative lipoic acid-binding regulatory protein
MIPSERLTLLEFPCDFPVKAFGSGDDQFDLTVVEIIRRHAPNLGEGAVAVRPSRGGRYQAVTVTIRAHSQKQLDAIYRDLSSCESVLMAL